MKKRILTGITTTGTPHVGNYLGAIKPSLRLAKESEESFFFLADYHALLKQMILKALKLQSMMLHWPGYHQD